MAYVCPHCKTSTQFKAKLTRPSIVNYSQAEVRIENEGQKFVAEVVACMKCNSPVTQEDLIPAEKCNKCGDMTPLSEMKDNLCVPCDALTNRSDLHGLTQQDLVRKLLELEGKIHTGSILVEESPSLTGTEG